MNDDNELILGGNARPTDVIADVSTADFKAKVMDASAEKPVLVNFWSPRSPQCKQLTPLLEKIVSSADGKVTLVKMNIDENPEIPGRLGVKSIPAVIAFQRGQPVDGFMGLVPETQIKGFIERLVGPIGSVIKEMLEAAEAALEAGDFESAMAGFQNVIEEDDSKIEAFGGLARTFIRMGDLESASEFIESLEDTIQKSPPISAAKAELNLAQQAGNIGELTELERRVAENPASHEARFELAVGLNAAGRHSEAADNLLNIIRADRTWNDEAARKQLLEFFEIWGPMHESTREARRKLSTILFS